MSTRRTAALILVASVMGARGADAQDCPANAMNPRPVTISYSSERSARVTLEPDADGTLRAFNEANGRELWSLAPAGLDANRRSEGLMSDITVLRFDMNLDGVIDRDAGDRVWLYFGMRRGGRQYRAIDVTDPDRPRELWRAGPAELPGVGETWSAPATARVRIQGVSQNGEHLVLIVGGGFDEMATAGHRIYMLDAADGRLLWYAAGPGGVELPRSADLPLPSMVSPVAGRVSALDTDADGFADLLYAADTGGRLWRFDVWNGETPVHLVSGGVLANLAGAGPAGTMDARRFFSGPDVALILTGGGAPYFNLALGSGDRTQPFATGVHDRLYAVRDYEPFEKLTQAKYDARIPLADADLIDITDAPATASIPSATTGWRVELRNGGEWRGEKSLAEATTLNGVIYYTTFEPEPGATCAESGRNRVYALRVEQGRPAHDLDNDGRVTENDASEVLDQHGIAGEVELQSPRNPRGEPPNPGDPWPLQDAFECSVGAEQLRFCASLKSLQRTFWMRKPSG